MSHDLLYALGEADANMYLCLKDLRPSEQKISYFSVFCYMVETGCIVSYLLSLSASCHKFWICELRANYSHIFQYNSVLFCSSEWRYWMGLYFGARQQELPWLLQCICDNEYDCTLRRGALPVKKHALLVLKLNCRELLFVCILKARSLASYNFMRFN